MYEILMTLIHHNENGTEYDVDSYIGKIGDIFTAQRGAHEYAKKITEIYGASWDIAEMNENEVWHTTCDFPNSGGGPATMHLVVQVMVPQTHVDPEILASLLSINTVFTEAGRPDSPQIPWSPTN